MTTLNPDKLAWLAGLWDGDGCFYIQVTPNGTLVLKSSIEMCHFSTIERVADFVGFGNCRTRARKAPNRRPQRSFLITDSEDNIEFLSAIIPYLIVKKKQAHLILSALKQQRVSTKLPDYGALVQEVKDLKSESFQKEALDSLVKTSTPRPYPYIAGLLDSDGCISISSIGRLEVSIVMTYLPVISYVSDVTGMGLPTFRKPQEVGYKPMWCFRTTASTALEFLEIIKNYVYTRLDQVNLAIYFQRWDTRLSRSGDNSNIKYRREVYRNKLSRLNWRGVSWDTKFTWVGDPHLKLSNFEEMTRLFELVEAQGLTVVWFGDMMHSKAVIHGKCMNFWLDYFKASPLHHIICMGNHDELSMGGGGCSLEFLRVLPNVELVTTPQSIPGTSLYVIPYIRDFDKLRKSLQIAPGGSVLICHPDIKGLDYGTGLISEEGCSLKDFSKFKIVGAGHYHRYQTSGNLTYLGTPFSHSFGESNQTKYIATYDVEEDHLKLIPTNLPQHRTLEVDCDVTAQLTLENPQDLYRIILLGTQANVEKFDQTLIQDQHETNVIFIKKPTNLEVKLHDITELSSPEKQFTEWGTIHKLSGQALKLGLSILGEVKC